MGRVEGQWQDSAAEPRVEFVSDGSLVGKGIVGQDERLICSVVILSQALT
jgi:hypothetical protein